MDLPVPSSTGSGYPTWKWSAGVGAKIAGTVTNNPTVKAIPNKIDPSKPAEENLIFEIHTDEPVSCANQKGERFEGQDWAIFIKVNSQPYRALFDAVKEQGADARFEKGDRFAQQLIDREDIGKPSLMNVFAVGVKKGAPAPAAAHSVSDLL